MKAILTLIFSLCSSSLFAQLTTTGGSTFSASALDNPAYAEAGGSPYIPLAFQKIIATRTTGEIDTLMARLDTFSDYLEVLKPGNKVLISKNQYQKLVVDISDEGMCVFKNGFNNPDWSNTNSFYRILYDGKVKLLKQTVHTLKDCYDYGGIYRKCFFKKEQHYIADNQGKLTLIEKDREKMWAAIPNADTVKQYAAQQKLKTKKWSDVVKILAFAESQSK